MKFIGITGGIGAGKSEILNYISRHYPAKIYLADQVAHLVEMPGTKAYGELVELLGKEILESNTRGGCCIGSPIDKKAMAAAIFADDSLLEAVNGIVHPAVREYLLQKLQEAREEGSTELFFVEAALLIECGYGELVDEMWYVYASEEVRVRRLMESRGYSEEKAKMIISQQLSEEEFRRGSDFVLDNSGSLEDTYSQIRQKLEAYSWRE